LKSRHSVIYSGKQLFSTFLKGVEKMGCGSSHKYDLIYDTHQQVAKYQKEFEAIGLDQRDVGLLYTSFLGIDIDNSGAIILVELTDFLLLEESSFVKRAFRAFDADRSKTIDFREFVWAVWDYCTLTKDSLGIIFSFASSVYSN
jgi:hypothetical protein